MWNMNISKFLNIFIALKSAAHSICGIISVYMSIVIIKPIMIARMFVL